MADPITNVYSYNVGGIIIRSMSEIKDINKCVEYCAEKKEPQAIKINGLKNITIIGSPKNDEIVLSDCENATVFGEAGADVLKLYNSKNINFYGDKPSNLTKYRTYYRNNASNPNPDKLIYDKNSTFKFIDFRMERGNQKASDSSSPTSSFFDNQY